MIPFNRADIEMFDTTFSVMVTYDLVNRLNISGGLDLNVKLNDKWREIIRSLNKLYKMYNCKNEAYINAISKITTKVLIKTKVFDVITSGIISSVEYVDNESVRFTISLDRNTVLVKSDEVRNNTLCVSLINSLSDMNEYKFNHFRYKGNIVNFELCKK